MPTFSSAAAASELALPPEVITRIFEAALTPPTPPPPLGTAPDQLLLSIARLSRAWTAFANARLYGIITPHSARARTFLLGTLRNRPELGALVRRLSLGPTRAGTGAIWNGFLLPLGGGEAGAVVDVCPHLVYLSFRQVTGFERVLPALSRQSGLRELVLDATTLLPGPAVLPALNLPFLTRLTLARISPELGYWPTLLDSATFPNLRALALIGYDGGVVGPHPGAPSIVARFSSHYNDFGPPSILRPGRPAHILWQCGEFEATCEWDETPERWARSGLAIEHVRFQRWTGRERYSHPEGNKVLYERVRRAICGAEPLLSELKSIYLSDAPAESAAEEGARDALVAECGRRRVAVVIERQPGEGESWVSEHFLAECEERARL